MVDFQAVTLEQVSVHLCGNKAREEGTRASAAPMTLDGVQRHLMLDYFLNSLNLDAWYKFKFVMPFEDKEEIHATSSSIFNSNDLVFHDRSTRILNALYDLGNNPMVKSGELYVAYFKDILVNDELVDGLGIFKTEAPEAFLQLKAVDGADFNVVFEQGHRKLRHAALILDTYADDGYRILTSDEKKYADQQYWFENFLNIEAVEDDAFHTKEYMTLVSGFINDVVSKVEDKLSIAEVSLQAQEYFDQNSVFDYNEFRHSVIDGDENRKMFDTYVQENTTIPQRLAKDFTIHASVAKKMRKHFKGLIKLDTGVELKITNTEPDEVIERAFDEEKQMFYYKVYFNQES